MAAITRADALALIREQDATEVWQDAAKSSAALSAFRVVNLGKKITNYPLIASLPTASFIAGEDADDNDAVKPATVMDWTDRQLVVEEIAGIVVIPENVLDDAEPDFDIWGEIRPRIAEAVGLTLDRAVFFGTNAPSTWPDGLVPAAIAAGNEVVEGSNGTDLAGDLSDTMGEVEDDGYDPLRWFTNRGIRRRVRNLRDDQNAPIWVTSLSASGQNVPSIWGVDVEYVTNGAWDSDVATALVGDPSKAVIGIRKDLEYKLLDQAAVDIGGGTLISLPQRDLLGLRFKMRVGFQTAETLTAEGGASAYPFAVLTPAGS